LQKPFQFGADMVVYSATKHIDGQGRCLGGVVLGSASYIKDELANFIRQTGPSLAPFNAWVLLKSLETLTLRVDAHCNNAERVAQFLVEHDGVSQVFYPGHESHPQYALAQKQMTRGSNLLAFEVNGGQEKAFALANALDIALISNNLGDAKTLITHPATTTHAKLGDDAKAELGIKQGVLRVSIGLEDGQDLLDDFAQALAQIQ
jgi:O-succinylhomoserine sulfhydrylase